MANDSSFPRVLISAVSSGSGKTLVTCALLRLLQKKGYGPVGYKCGPDYIDPMFHKQVLNIPSKNLDIFLAGYEGVKQILTRGKADGDIGVIEGVMGLYDGMDPGSDKGSAYDLARTTGTPVILVADVKGMSRSIIPLIKGFVDYDTEGLIKGIILNNISDRIAQSISGDIEKELGIPVIGHLPVLKGDGLKSRHLGLIMPSEIPDIAAVIDRTADALGSTLDLDKLINIAHSAALSDDGEACAKAGGDRSKDITDRVSGQQGSYKTRVGIAYDKAFCFYYEENIRLLKELGAELVFFSPIYDKKLPDVDRFIIGGGYPELHAKKIADNIGMKEDIKKAAADGMPILAECGGFMYLQDALTDAAGKRYAMAGVLNGESHMTDRLGHFGYVNVTAVNDGPYLKKGETIRGHEFHYSDSTDNGAECDIIKPSGAKGWKGYQIKGNVFAGYAHLYYPSAPEFIERFLSI